MAGDQSKKIEYWHDAVVERKPSTSFQDHEIVTEPAGWKTEKPPREMSRVPGLVHETSTLYMSDYLENDHQASVDTDYRPRGCDNVYVTGGALFPSSGSWNRKSHYDPMSMNQV